MDDQPGDMTEAQRRRAMDLEDEADRPEALLRALKPAAFVAVRALLLVVLTACGVAAAALSDPINQAASALATLVVGGLTVWLEVKARGTKKRKRGGGGSGGSGGRAGTAQKDAAKKEPHP